MCQINGYILHMSLPYIVEPLTYIFNLCIQYNTFPVAFKKAKVVPIPKTKDTTDVNNLRPISLLSVLSKPLEKHVQKHLLQYLEERSLLNKFQSGFRPKHSCHSALVRMIDSWLDNINNNKMSGTVFLDLKKAFDLINHEILLRKLNAYFNNSSPSALSFFNSYLSARTQAVYVNGNYSTEGKVELGVPQGSVLGPLLFCIFINDLPLHITCASAECDMFADDSTLHAAGKTVADITNSLQQSLQEVSEWCSSNRMIVNPTKTKSMLVTTRQKHQLQPAPLNLSFEAVPIEQVQ
jgi:retron-type reverse transcriptase